LETNIIIEHKPNFATIVVMICCLTNQQHLFYADKDAFGAPDFQSTVYFKTCASSLRKALASPSGSFRLSVTDLIFKLQHMHTEQYLPFEENEQVFQ
jgi:hypothetical protein